MTNSSVLKEIEVWLETHINSQLPRSTWFESDQYMVYVRSKSNVSYFVGKPVAAISSITVTYPGNGTGSAVIAAIENIASSIGYAGVAIEEVINPRFESHLTQNGWLRFGGIEPPTFVKFFDN